MEDVRTTLPPLPPPWGGLRRDRPFANAPEAAAVARAAGAALQAEEMVVVSLDPPSSPAHGGRHVAAESDDEGDPDRHPLGTEYALDDVEADKARQYEAMRASNAALNTKLWPHFVARCQRDQLFALLYAFDECGMNESLENMVQYVLKQYALDAEASARYQTRDAAYVRETFEYVVHRAESRVAKLALALFVLAREPRVEARVRAECPPEQAREFTLFMHALRYLAHETLQCKYNRQNIRNVLSTFVVRTGAVYVDGVMPAGLDPQQVAVAMNINK